MRIAFITLFFIQVVYAQAKSLSQSLELISSGKTSQGLIELEEVFNTLSREDKILAANLLALSSSTKLINGVSYYAKYVFKLDSSLKGIKKAKILRILADENFKSGNINSAIKQYLEAISLTKEKELVGYLVYKLGWAYVNNNNYIKTFELWKPYLTKENSLSSQTAHDYGKFWAEYSIQSGSVLPLSKIQSNYQENLLEGIKNGLIRHRKKLNIFRLLKKLSSLEDKQILIAAYTLITPIKTCEMLKFKSFFNENSISPLRVNTLNKHLNKCLADKQSWPEKHSDLYFFYSMTPNNFKEKFILSKKLNNQAQSCLISNQTLFNEEDINTINLIIKNTSANCIIKPESIQRFFKKYKVSVQTSLYPLLENKFIALEYLSLNEVDNNELTKHLLKGLLKTDKFLAYYSQARRDHSDLLIKHLYFTQSKDEKVIKQIKSLISSQFKTQLQLYIFNNIDKKMSTIDTNLIIQSCNNYTDTGLHNLLAYIIDTKNSDLFFNAISCFNISEKKPNKNFVLAAISSQAQAENNDFLSSLNRLIFRDHSYIKSMSFRKYLKKNYPSLYILNRMKLRLIELGTLDKKKIITLNKRLSFYRTKLLAVTWFTESSKEMGINFYNLYLDKKILELEKLKLSKKEITLLKNNFIKYRI